MGWRGRARSWSAAWSALRTYGVARSVARALRRLRERRAYRAWVARPRLALARSEGGPGTGPLISILMPTFEPEVRWLLRALQSVQAQSYDRWELCVADDASSRGDAREALDAVARSDSRVRVRRRASRGHISAASNTALEMARGDFVALLDQDDELPPAALERVARELQRHPEADLVYTDEDKIDSRGRRREPYFKPDWSPDLLLSQNLVSHLGVYRASRVREIGGFRQGFEGSQDHDLALRVMERDGAVVRHVTDVLYHWRITDHSTAGGAGRKDYAVAAGLRAIQSHLDRLGCRATVERTQASYYRVRWALPDPPPQVDLVALEPLGEGPVPSRTRDDRLDVRRHPVARPVPAVGRAALLNAAARSSRGDVLVFLGPRCVFAPGALQELVSQALRQDVGLAGGKIVTADARVRHAGYLVTLDPDAPVLSAHAGLHADEPGHFGRNVLVQNFSAVSADAMAVRREIFEDLGGFDADAFPEAFFDVDLGLRVREKGLRVVWTPWARAIAPSSFASRRGAPPVPESRRLVERWGERLPRDPYWHPELDRRHADFRVRR